MAKVFELLSTYEAIRYTTGGAETFSAGDYKQVSEVGGFALIDVAISTLCTLVIKAPRVKVVKKSGQTWTAGEEVYYDPAVPDVSNVALALEAIGHVERAAASADTHGYINFDGTHDV